MSAGPARGPRLIDMRLMIGFLRVVPRRSPSLRRSQPGKMLERVHRPSSFLFLLLGVLLHPAFTKHSGLGLCEQSVLYRLHNL